MNICMLVMNSVSMDARVLKEANSLISQGNKVTVIGVKDKQFSTPYEKAENGLEVFRLDWLKQILRYRRPVIFVVFFFIAGLVAWFLSLSLALVLVLVAKLARNAFFSSSLFYLYNKLLALFLYKTAVLEQLKGMDIDVVHAHDLSTLPTGLAIKKKFDVPLIYDAHEIYEETVGINTLIRKLYRWMNRTLLTKVKVDHFITISDSFVEYYKDRYPASPDAVVIMNATVKTDYVDYDGRLHVACNLPLDKKIILFQGGLSKKRGVLHLLDAAEYLDAGWTLVFMGWGFYEEEIKAASMRLGGDRIKIIPAAPQSELVCWTAGASVGVIPYEEHGLNHKYCTPNKLWEYPNALVPILASPRVEMSKIIKCHDIGRLLTEPVNASHLASELMFSDEEIISYKHNGKKFIETNSWAKYEANLFDIYDEIKSVNQV